MTPYGERVARELATAMARAGAVVVSGLAPGIDCAAHAGALAAGREHNVGDVSRRDARVGEFAFEHRSDLFGKRAGDAVAVVGSCSLFRHGPNLSFQHLRIPNLPG